MINRPGLEHLRLFLQKKDQASASFLITIPALYNVIQHEFQIYKHILPTTFGVCSWLYVRGETVRRMLLHHMTDPANLSINEKSIHWAKVCMKYTLLENPSHLKYSRRGAYMGCPKLGIDHSIPNSKKENVLTQERSHATDAGNTIPGTAQRS